MPLPEFEPIKGKPGWHRANVGSNVQAVEEMAGRLSESRPPHTYFVCGFLPDDTQYALYRIETRDPLVIVQDFEVGSHAPYSKEDVPTTVLAQLALVHASNPIVPFFADSAGLKCTFERPLTEEFAELLDSTITEGVEIYADEGYIGPVVMREKILHLWWD